MSVRVLVILGFIFSLALPRCTCLPPLLSAEDEETSTAPGAEVRADTSGNGTTARTSSVSVSGAGGSIASPNYRMELSVGRTTQGSSPGFQLRPSTVGDK